MTKKILALALAGSTAFSVFAGALSVNAAPGDWDAGHTTYSWGVTPVDGAFEDLTGTSAAPATTVTIDKISTEDITDARFEYAADKYYTDDWNVGIADNVDAFNTAVANAAEGAQLSTIKAQMDAAYGDPVTLKDATGGTGDNTYRTAINTLLSNYNSIKKFFAAPGTDNTLNAVKVDETYDIVSFDEYEADALFKAIYAAVGGSAVLSGGAPAITDVTVPFSYVTYLNNEYTRIIGIVDPADTTSMIDKYDELYNKLSERVAEDYTKANWRNFQRLLEDAEDLAAEAKNVAGWTKAYNKLVEASKVEPEAGKYADLQDALIDLFIDGKISIVVANPEYPTADKTKAIYLAADYQETYRTGTKVTSDAYKAAFINTHDVTTRDSAYSKAWDVWSTARKSGGKVAQSDIDTALEELEAAIAALEPSSTAPNYQMVLLETALENVAGYVDTDYNATSRKYKDFTVALEKAEEVMAKTNPTASEVESAYKKLAATASDLASVTKAIPSSLKKSLTDTRKEANVTLKEIGTKSGAQYAALQEAIAFAAAVAGDDWDADDVNTYIFKDKSTISDYEAAIAELEKAINGFNQAQGWYQENGKWMYGVNNGVLNNGWEKIGNFWFFFNEDGTAKEAEWFQDGGKWYYAGSTCVAYSGWGKVDGSWYYFGKDCAMATGWVRPSNSYYYLDPTSGKMVTGWAQIGGKWYYFSTDANTLGAMLTSTTTPDGYQVGADGAMI